MRWGGGGGSSGGVGRMGVYALWELVPPALGHCIACLLWDLSSKLGQSLSTYCTVQPLITYTLLRYSPWVPRRGGGVPMCCFCHGCPIGGGGPPVCPCAFALYLLAISGPKLYLNITFQWWHQPGVCLPIVFPCTLSHQLRRNFFFSNLVMKFGYVTHI